MATVSSPDPDRIGNLSLNSEVTPYTEIANTANSRDEQDFHTPNDKHQSPRTSKTRQSRTFPLHIGTLISDSGATSHMLQTGIPAIPGTKVKHNKTIGTANPNATLQSSFAAQAIFQAEQSPTKTLSINNAHSVPGISKNLLSTPSLDKEGKTVIYGNGSVIVLDNTDILKHVQESTVLARGTLGRNGLYEIMGGFQVRDNTARGTHADVHTFLADLKNEITHEQESQLSALIGNTYTGDLNKLELAHIRWGCLAEKTIRAIGGDQFKNLTMRPCRCCLEMNMTIPPASKEARSQPNRIGQILQADLSGKLRTKGPRGEQYIATVVDTYLSSADVAGVKLKSEMYDVLKHVILRNDRRGHHTNVIGLDQGGENISQQLSEFCYEKGIEVLLAAPQVHSSIGGVESYQGKMFRVIRAQMRWGGAPARFVFWAAKNYANVQKLIPRSAKLGSSPYEMTHGIKDPHIIGSVKTLFSEVWFLLNPEKRGERGDKHFDAPAARRGVLLCNGGDIKDGTVIQIGRAHV